MDKQIADVLKKVLKKIVQVKEIDENANLLQKYNMDSLSTLELILELENELDVRIPNEAIGQISTFKNAVAVLTNLKKEQAAA